jgi:hypothetical protein
VNGRDEVLARIADAVTLVAADRDAARVRLGAIWTEVEAGDPLHRCVLAHYLADLQDDVRDELRWDLRALAAADEVAQERDRAAAETGGALDGRALDVRALYPSLHLNLGDDYRRLGAAAQAREHLALARAAEHVLPDDGYGRMIRGGIADLARRLDGVAAAPAGV